MFLPGHSVNAGASHSYIMMADGTTSYLSELKMGDEVMVVKSDGGLRNCVVGRVKLRNARLFYSDGRMKMIMKQGSSCSKRRPLGSSLNPENLYQ